MRILLIEDDEKLSKNISFYLEKYKYIVDRSKTVAKALQYLNSNVYDIILLDWMLPDGEGTEILKENRNNIPVIMLTAKSMLSDKVEAFELGVDDYLSKPFMLPELLARIKSILRRNMSLDTNVINLDQLEIDLNKYEVRYKGNTLNISGKQFSILEYLVHKIDHVVSRDELSERVLDTLENETNLVDVYISTIRKEIKKYSDREYIKTVKGVGYMLCSK